MSRTIPGLRAVRILALYHSPVCIPHCGQYSEKIKECPLGLAAVGLHSVSLIIDLCEKNQRPYIREN